MGDSRNVGPPPSRSSHADTMLQHRRESDASFLGSIEMSQDNIFSGPISESVPTSNVGFSHYGGRAESPAIFTYFEEGDDSDSGSWLGEEVLLDDVEDADAVEEDTEGSDNRTEDSLSNMGTMSEFDSHFQDGESFHERRKSSNVSRLSLGSRRSRLSATPEDPLLRRHNSSGSGATGTSARLASERTSQKLFIQSEDLTIVIAGFRTSRIGLSVYGLLCLLTGGLAYLLFRWLPRTRVKLIGSPEPLHSCSWVVIENQWGEAAIQNVNRIEYGQSLSTVFGMSERRKDSGYDEDHDPTISFIRTLDYRYIRLCFHPLRSKFLISNTWKDSDWTDTENMREGIDADKIYMRAKLFGGQPYSLVS